jgi:Na+-transporting NADH:ubiquinone oxidoreductase subunit NqrC
VPAGEYELIALVSTTPVARWFVTLTLTTATFQVYDKAQTVLMVADVLNASALAADAVAEIQSGLATPTNITAATGITVSSIEANVVTASALAADAVAEIADGIWDEATSGHTTGGTYGGRIVRATNSNTEVQITGSNHIAADVHEFQAGVITAGDFAANSITASALAADAVTEIQSGLATAANLLIVNDGVGFLTSVLLGTISDAGTAGETYVITFGGATYTLDYTGLDATGNRSGVTRTKV